MPMLPQTVLQLLSVSTLWFLTSTLPRTVSQFLSVPTLWFLTSMLPWTVSRLSICCKNSMHRRMLSHNPPTVLYWWCNSCCAALTMSVTHREVCWCLQTAVSDCCCQCTCRSQLLSMCWQYSGLESLQLCWFLMTLLLLMSPWTQLLEGGASPLAPMRSAPMMLACSNWHSVQSTLLYKTVSSVVINPGNRVGEQPAVENGLVQMMTMLHPQQVTDP